MITVHHLKKFCPDFLKIIIDIRKRDSFQKLGGATYGNMLPIAKRVINIIKTKKRRKWRKFGRYQSSLWNERRKCSTKVRNSFKNPLKLQILLRVTKWIMNLLVIKIENYHFLSIFMKFTCIFINWLKIYFKNHKK